MKQYPHLATRVFNAPLLINPQKLDVILHVLSPRLGLAAAPAVDDAALAEPEPRPAAPDIAGVAVLPIYGCLVHRAGYMDAMSGMVGYTDIHGMLSAALDDPRVQAIMLDIDSPGGEVGGAFETADMIYQAGKVKPVWALANNDALSAGYLLAAAANRVYITSTGGAGSVGVIALHVDQSAADAADGLRYTAVYAGAHKNDFTPHEPLSPGARARLQTEVDRTYGLFAGAVANYRGLPLKAVLDQQADVYFGQEAIDAGLADAIGSWADTMAGIASHAINQPNTAVTIRVGGAIASHTNGGAIASHVNGGLAAPALITQSAAIAPSAAPVDGASVSGSVAVAAIQPSIELQEVIEPMASTPTVQPQYTPAELAEIANLAATANLPDAHKSIFEWTAAGKSLENIRAEIAARKSDRPEEVIHSHIRAEGGILSPPDANPLQTAMRARLQRRGLKPVIGGY